MGKQQIKNRLAQIRHALEPFQNREDIKNTIQYCLIELDDVLHDIAESTFTSAIDLTGQTFGQLTVIGRGGKVKWSNTCGYRYNWLCRCSCGNVSEYTRHTLLHHKGNLPQMCNICAMKQRNTTHGQSKSRLYGIWSVMKQRCYDTNVPQYKFYGAKGITVCDEWLADYEAFADWAITHGYRPDNYLNRRNFGEGYSPSNCYWGERSKARPITIDGETHTLLEWSRIKNVPYSALLYRVNAGWPIERLFTKSKERKKNGKD